MSQNANTETRTISLTRGQVALIDANDWAVVSAFSWHASWSPRLKQYYAVAGVKREDGKYTSLYMHRLITGAPKGKEVDHLNHDTLDNRRANLRVGSHKANMENGKFALATHCPRGHAYDETNTYYDARGRRCRECMRVRNREVQAALTPEQLAQRSEAKKAYYQRTKPERKAQMKRYAEANRDARRVYWRKWYAENRAKKR